MYFANGDIKEGYFENGVFKFEGNENEIKQYMIRNKLIKHLKEDGEDVSNGKMRNKFRE